MAPAPAALTEYERKRLENIKRNEQMMASLKLQHQVAVLSSAVKRPRPQSKSYKGSPDKKMQKSQSPIVIRRSLRARGLPPDAATTATGLLDDSPSPSSLKTRLPLSPINRSGPLTLQEAHHSGSEDRLLVDAIIGMSENAPLSGLKRMQGAAASSAFKLDSLTLKEENVARILPSRTLTVKFFPSLDRTVIVAGDKLGNVGFWDADSPEEQGDGIYLYSPHSAPVSGIAIHPFSLHKIFTSSYDGFLRLMDVGEEKFNIVYSCDEAIFSLSQQPNDSQSLFFGESQGGFKIWDLRRGKISTSVFLHSRRINSIDFNPANTNLMATSSTDGSACIWDLRSLRSDRPKRLKMVEHQKAVHSAYFSPSGSYLATTSIDNHIGLVSGIDFVDTEMINHYNQTSRWISTFRAIWGWDDNYLFVGNIKRAVDVICIADRSTISMESQYMTAIPCRFAAHPYKVGALAGSTGGGQVYIWVPK